MASWLEEIKTFGLTRNKIIVAKTHEDARIPTKRDEDGAYDIYACFDEDAMYIPKAGNLHRVGTKRYKSVLISSGLSIATSKKYRLSIKDERSSVGSLRASVLCGLVDSGYRGTIFVNLVPLEYDMIISKTYPFEIDDKGNKVPTLAYIHDETEEYISTITEHTLTDKLVIVYPYERAIAQVKVERSPSVKVVETSYDKLKSISSDRGTGRLGSSGK